MTTLSYAEAGARDSRAPLTLIGRLRGVTLRIRAARKGRRDFAALSGASDHVLSDIGLTRADVQHALTAPFWVNPSDRLGRRGR